MASDEGAVPPGGTFTNPVVAENAPDPGVAWVHGAWYVVCTGRGNGGSGGAFPIRRSEDLVTWFEAGCVFPGDSLPAWSDGTAYWAPEIHVWGGTCLVYFTARNHDKTLCVGVATAARPEGPYHELGSPLVEESVGAIDPTFFYDADLKTQFLIWKVDGNSRGQPSVIKLRELESPTKFAPGSEAVALIQSDLPWEGIVVEGPWMIKHNGEYFLFYSGAGYAGAAYCVGVARAASIYGPFTKAAAPILSQAAPDEAAVVRKWAGPGHCSVVSTDAGFLMVYHAWRADHVNRKPGRLVLLDRVEWGPGGWPVVGTAGTPTAEAQPGPELPLAVPLCLRVGSCYRLQTSQWEHIFWSGDGTISQDACTFRVHIGRRPGGTVSLEAVSKPGQFVRHRDSLLELAPPDGSALFDADASFMALPGLLDGKTSSVSLRSVNYPHAWVRHRDGQLRIEALEASDLFAHDATFVPVPVSTQRGI